ncbi:signal peptidase I [Kitasatospora sp. MAP12-15]|uniref:signal peptidase I n=1 Tax=unclassified Kitasatospora TaxID=2633591 RepID=UPI002476C8BD|nr:signal peptidase I [Kitasatospora sp. MAP12-44]MDH6114795.1 signal peptidase I [Kitasatospora sp. MAP12-44]
MESPAEGAALEQSGPQEPEEPEELAEAAQPAPAERPRRPLWKELPILVVIALVLALLIKTFLVQAFSIPSDSMQNTLQQGDRVLVDKLTPWFGSTPARGDVVVFHDPGGWLNSSDMPPQSSNGVVRDLQSALSTVGLMPSANEKDLIKRVIAVGGDTVQCTAGEPVKVNGVALNEPYIYPGATPCDNDPVGTVTVPKGKLWVMGDHRDDSWDSRHQRIVGNEGGFVPVGNVIGRAFVVAWPLDRWSTLPEPATFSQHGLAAGPALAAAPSALGAVAGALPLTLWYRRRRR